MPGLREDPVRRHEAGQHRADQLRRLDGALPGFTREDLAVGKQIPVDGGGKFQRQLDGLVVVDGSKLELFQLSLLNRDTVQEQGRG